MGVKIKGQGLVAFERTLLQLKGPEAMEPVLAGASPEAAHAVRSREILPVGWYPMEWFASLHESARVAYGPAISREIGRAATRHDVTTLYRFILRFLSPETLIDQSSRILSLVIDGGAVALEERRRGFARLRYSGCAGSSRGAWEDFIGSNEVLLELCGAQQAVGTILEGGEGASMVCSLSWKV